VLGIKTPAPNGKVRQGKVSGFSSCCHPRESLLISFKFTGYWRQRPDETLGNPPPR